MLSNLSKQEVLDALEIHKKTLKSRRKKQKYFTPIQRIIIDATTIEKAYFEIAHSMSECKSFYNGIGFREDLYDNLVISGIEESEAEHITSKVRKGLSYKLNFDEINLNNSLMEWCLGVKYLPSRSMLLNELLKEPILKDIYTELPQFSSLVTVSFEFSDAGVVLPDYIPDSNTVICLYGYSENELSSHLEPVKKIAEKLAGDSMSYIRAGEMWDIEIKPIFLFDKFETLIKFYDFANELNEADFFEMVEEMQREYNIPWGRVKLLDENKTQEIINYYDRRFFND